MNKRTPGRIVKGKGFNLKYALQIFLLIGVCCWMIYQVKRTHDKKAELRVTTSDENTLAIGRKGLNRHVDTSKLKDEEEEEDEGDVRLEQEIEEAEMRHREEESRLEEKERDSDDKESEGEGEDEEDEEKQDMDQNQEDGGKPVEDDLEEGDDSHEAREENYKADDVSSEVAHEEDNDASATNPPHLGDNSTDADELLHVVGGHSMKNSSSSLGVDLTKMNENRKSGNNSKVLGVENEDEESSTYESDSSADNSNSVELDTLSDSGLNGVNDRNAETE